jgi:predicted Zn-dependent peptidase
MMLLSYLALALAGDPAPTSTAAPTSVPVEDPLAGPPALAPTAEFKPPTPVASNLSNGASLWVVPMQGLPLVSAVIEVKGGSVLDPVGKEGLAALSNLLMTKGAGDLDALAFAEEVERLGIQLDAGTSSASSYITVSAQKNQIDRAFELIADMILRPAYSGGDFKRERKLGALDILMEQDNPVVVARRLATSLYFGPGSAWGRPPEGTVSGIKALKRKEVQEFHNKVWVAGGASITIAGALGAEEAKAVIEKYLGTAWAKGVEVTLPGQVLPPHQSEPIYLVDRPGSAQTMFFLMFPGKAMGNPGEASLRAGTIALGGTFTSRLNQLLREKRGYTYGVRAGLIQWPGMGVATITTRIRTDATGPAMTDLVNELKRVREGISQEEIVKAQLAFQQDQVEAMESRDGLVAALSEYHFQGLGVGGLEAALTAMRGVQGEQVTPALGAYDLSGAIVVLVGDRAVIEGPLKEAGFDRIQVMNPI